MEEKENYVELMTVIEWKMLTRVDVAKINGNDLLLNLLLFAHQQCSVLWWNRRQKLLGLHEVTDGGKRSITSVKAVYFSSAFHGLLCKNMFNNKISIQIKHSAYF